MKNNNRWLGAAVVAGMLSILLPSRSAEAQIFVTLKAEATRYLLYEPLQVTVTLRNELGVPLILNSGEGSADLAFEIEQSPGRPLRPAAGRAAAEPRTVEPWKTETLTIDLLREYEILRPGPYRIVARVTVGGIDFLSTPALVDVLPGLEIVRTTAMAEDGSRRVLSLRTLVRDRHDYAFIQILDEDRSVCYATHNIGSIIRHFKPLLQVSSDQTVHTLHQSAPTRYTHSVTRLNGQPVSITYYSTSPVETARFRADRRGVLRVEGVLPYRGDPVVEPVRPPPSDRNVPSR